MKGQQYVDDTSSRQHRFWEENWDLEFQKLILSDCCYWTVYILLGTQLVDVWESKSMLLFAQLGEKQLPVFILLPDGQSFIFALSSALRRRRVAYLCRSPICLSTLKIIRRRRRRRIRRMHFNISWHNQVSAQQGLNIVLNRYIGSWHLSIYLLLLLLLLLLFFLRYRETISKSGRNRTN